MRRSTKVHSLASRDKGDGSASREQSVPKNGRNHSIGTSTARKSARQIGALVENHLHFHLTNPMRWRYTQASVAFLDK